VGKGKRYDCRVVKDNTFWIAEIVRRLTSKKTIVSKSQGGFNTESEAQAWGRNELKSFLQSLNERNKRRSNKES